ncbi:MAG: hypothetical protein JW810_12750 [Sedimentisphaerales bacterium]|nr:hypothetical protein [Sedimentisphaerales bacterium]
MVHPIIQRFECNCRGFWNRYRWYIVFFSLAIFCDALSTIHFMHQDGHEVELHPLYRRAAELFGYTCGPLLGFGFKLTTGILVCIYLRNWARYIFLSVTVISFWASWYNIWGRENELMAKFHMMGFW